MKKVLFLVTSLEVGGIETYLLRFLNFSKDNIEATVFCKSGFGGTLENKYKELNINVVKFKIGYFPFYNAIKFYRLLKRENYSAICDFTGDFAGLTLLLAKLANIEKRLSFYRGSRHRFKQDVFRLFYNKIVKYLVFKNATKVLSNSEAALNYFHPNWKNNNNDKFKIIQNGVPMQLFDVEFDKLNLRQELGIKSNAFVIGHVGRFDSSKNHYNIIKVANQLCVKYDNVYFLLCGQGVKNGVENLKGINILNSKILMPGLRNDIPNVLRIMDSFFFPSLIEGQPNALIEAMVVGLPIVASNIDPIKECVPKDFHSGCLVNPNDNNKSIDILSSYIENRSKIDFQLIKQFVRNNFKSNIKFNQFLKEL